MDVQTAPPITKQAGTSRPFVSGTAGGTGFTAGAVAFFFPFDGAFSSDGAFPSGKPSLCAFASALP